MTKKEKELLKALNGLDKWCQGRRDSHTPTTLADVQLKIHKLKKLIEK